MGDEEKSQTGVESSSSDGTASKEDSSSAQTTSGVGCISSPASADNSPDPDVVQPKPTDIDSKTEHDKSESSNEALNKCLKVSEKGASSSENEDISEKGTVKEESQEPLAVSSSEPCDNPKTDSEADLPAQNNDLSKNEDPINLPGSHQRSSEKEGPSEKIAADQLTETSSNENSKTESSEEAPILGTQTSSHSVLSDSNENSDISSNDGKLQENIERATSPQEKEGGEKKLHDGVEVESQKESPSNTADLSSVQSKETDTCSAQKDSKECSGASPVASPTMSSEVDPPIAHADVSQDNSEEAMDTTPVCEDSDPFASKDAEKNHDVPMEVDSEANPVENTGNKSSSIETAVKSLDENLVENEHHKSTAEDDSAMEVDTSPVRCEGPNPESDQLDKNSANVMSENMEENSNDKQTPSEKDSATPEPDQTIIGSRMPDEGIESVASQEVSKSLSDKPSATETDSSALVSSSTSDKASSEQGDTSDSKNDDSENAETCAKKSLEVNKPKVGIQLVSTSSLVSRLDTSSKDVDSDAAEESNDTNLQTEDGPDENCAECGKMVKCKYKVKKGMGHVYLCEDECYTKFRKENESPRPKLKPRKVDQAFEHTCGQCSKIVDMKLEKSLTWETMDFCNAVCLEKCQRTHGSNCANCKAFVQSASLGKYCVRFGYDMKQFCSAPCLEDFKKGLKVCSYCQKDISRGDGFLAPVGDKSTFKDFCAQECMQKYEQMSNNTVPPEVTEECAVCNQVKSVRVEVLWEENLHKLCSDPCFAAFKFVNDIAADKCDMCKKYYDRDRPKNFSVFYDEAPHSFCCKTCMNVYILAKRKIVPCSFCKVKKYNFDMIKKVSGQNVIMMCSLHCLEQYQAAPTAASSSKPGATKKVAVKKVLISTSEKEKSASKAPTIPVISSVTSLAGSGQPPAPSSDLPPTPALVPSTGTTKSTGTETVKTVYKQQFILRPPPHPEMSNCAVQVKPMTATKSVACQPEVREASTQTDDSSHQPVLIPIPVPIYIPMPMHMYTVPYPVPVPIALPIPVPFFIPTTKNSAKGILQEIKRIQENIPSDPFEAELLMMAEMVAGEKKGENTETDSEDNDADNDNDAGNASDPDFSPEQPSAIGDDMLHMALMGTGFDEPSADFEGTVTPTSASQSARSRAAEGKDESEGEEIEADRKSLSSSGKRAVKRSSSRSSSVSSKRMRTSSASDHPSSQPGQEFKTFPKPESVDKPDANMWLKFTLGVNAWKNWVLQKNAGLEKSPSNKIKPFKTELLQLSSDELNYSLCLFVCEAQDQNGRPFSPDTLYYLCLGIQRYLMENGREINIFCDPYYEKFTDCLDDAVKRFSPLDPSSQRLVTRIQEEHLWESKQLGANSPFVLLMTLMYFNTKHFNLMTVEEHMQLSFSHIMKHWKRNATSPNTKTLGVRSNNVLLRFYPPQSALAADSKKKKVYEQQENESNALRCPVKLYEFYLSKCPESVKTRNDVFYLLPERSCVPDSPVWYSTMSLDHDHLQKMLHRVKMVREIVNL